MRGIKIAVIVAALFLAAATCLTAQPAKWKGKVVEENGVRVVVNPPQPLLGDVTLKLKEELTISGRPDEKSLFQYDIDVTADIEGRIYILDQKEGRIQVFDKNGKYVLTIGKKGGGSGELSGPSGVFLLGPKSIYSMDATRINVFGRTGTWERSVALDAGLGGNGSYAFAANGTSLAVVSTRKPNGNRLLEAVSFDANGKKIKTVLQAIDTYHTYSAKGDVQNLDADRLWIAPRPGELAVCGSNRTYDLLVVGDNGVTAFIIRKEEKPIAYSEVERQSRIGAAKKAEEQTRSTAARRNLVFELPVYRPYFKSFLVDDAGRVYVVRDYEKADIFSGLELELFDGQGYCLVRLKLPSMILPASIVGDKIYAKWMDKKTGLWQIKRHRMVNYDKIFSNSKK